MIDVLPPHNTEAEEAVLGSLMIDPYAIETVASILKPEMFYVVKHAWVYQAILALHEKGQAVDLLTVASELISRNQLQDTGGEGWLAELCGSVPTALNVESYAQIVAELAQRRDNIRFASEVVRLSYRQDEPLDKVDKILWERVEAAGSAKKSNMVSIGKVIADLVAEAENPSEDRSIATGFYELNKSLGGGLQPNRFYLVAGRPGSGKTALLLQLALAAAMQGKHVAIFSMEMSAAQLVDRLVSNESGLPARDIRQGKLNEEELDRLLQSCILLGSLPIMIDDSSGTDVQQISAICKGLRAKGQLDMVVVDYLQLVQSGKPFKNRVDEVGYISRSLKLLSMDLSVPALVGAQLSRAIEGRANQKPQLSDIRESGSAEQDADVVTFIDRPETYSDDPQLKGIARIACKKNRDGETFEKELYFAQGKFSNLTKERIEL